VQQFRQHLVDKDVLAFLPLFESLTVNTRRYAGRLLSKIKPMYGDIVGRLARDFASGRPIDQWLRVGDAPVEGGYWDAPDGSRLRYRELIGPEPRWVHEYWADRQRVREGELLKCLRLLRMVSCTPTPVEPQTKGPSQI